MAKFSIYDLTIPFSECPLNTHVGLCESCLKARLKNWPHWKFVKNCGSKYAYKCADCCHQDLSLLQDGWMGDK